MTSLRIPIPRERQGFGKRGTSRKENSLFLSFPSFSGCGIFPSPKDWKPGRLRAIRSRIPGEGTSGALKDPWDGREGKGWIRTSKQIWNFPFREKNLSREFGSRFGIIPGFPGGSGAAAPPQFPQRHSQRWNHTQPCLRSKSHLSGPLCPRYPGKSGNAAAFPGEQLPWDNRERRVFSAGYSSHPINFPPRRGP